MLTLRPLSFPADIDVLLALQARIYAGDPSWVPPVREWLVSRLNPPEVAEMLGTFRRLKEQGVTVIMIEHLMHAVMNVCDRVIVLDYGKKIAEGTPQEITSDPKVIEAYLGDPKIAEQFLAESAP